MDTAADPASQCAADTYNANAGSAMTPYAGTATTCDGCPTGMVTVANTTGATSKDACLAPPGYGFNAQTTTAAICIAGEYNPGYNREACVSCGDGISTAGPGAETVGECFIPAGWGMTQQTDGAWKGTQCPVNTFGRANSTFGLVEVECTKCPENTYSAAGSTSVLDCKTNPGYGWNNGEVQQCTAGSWATGGDQKKCTPCGTGYTTATAGAVNATECVVALGWTLSVPGDINAGLSQCPFGSYKDTLGNAACTVCGNGTTTSVQAGAVAATDCDACEPGYGSADIAADNYSCGMCASGSYSPGNTKGGASCVTCPNPASFNGLMVSRKVRGCHGCGCHRCLTAA